MINKQRIRSFKLLPISANHIDLAKIFFLFHLLLINQKLISIIKLELLSRTHKRVDLSAFSQLAPKSLTAVKFFIDVSQFCGVKFMQIIVSEVQSGDIILQTEITLLRIVWATENVELVLDIEAGTPPARSHIRSLSNVYFVERTVALAKRFVVFEAGKETRKQRGLIVSFEKLAKIVLYEIELRRPIKN